MSEPRQPAPRRGTNLPRMGDFNLTVIMDAIRRAESGISRVELAQLVGLSPQTISNICRRLLDQQLIAEVGKAGSGPGKPRTILRLNPRSMFAVGVHLDPSIITVVLLDLVGSIIEKESFPTPPSHAPEEVVAAITAAVEGVISRSGVSRTIISGIGVAAPGPIDLVRGAVVGPPLLKGWDDVPLRALIQASTGLEAIMDKDVTGAAVAEVWAGGAGGAGSFAFFYLGTGLGCGLVLNEEVYRGHSGNAGEVGHIVVDPDGPLCSCGCGLRGTVGSSLEPQVIVGEAVAAGVIPAFVDPLSAEGYREAFMRLCEAADRGDEAAIRVLQPALVRLSRAIAVVGNLVDVERVVLGGPFWAPLAKHCLRELPGLLNAGLATRGIHEVQVSGTSLGEDVGAIGAASLVLERAFAPRAERLLLDA